MNVTITGRVSLRTAFEDVMEGPNHLELLGILDSLWGCVQFSVITPAALYVGQLS